MKFNLAIDPRKEVLSIVAFIKETVRTCGFKRIVVACSGGVDSSTVFFLATRAFGFENVYPLFLPYRSTHPHSLEDGMKAVRVGSTLDGKLNPSLIKKRVEVIDIGPMVDRFVYALGLTQHDRLRIGNIMARCRMIVLFDRAKKHNALVLGTENKSEHYLGYFTRFGDEASDIEPIRHLYKTQVFELASYLGVPQSIIKKAPTAGLWVDQTDEGQFGFNYQDADPILHLLYDQKQTVEDVLKMGFSRSLVFQVKDWVEKNHFKHELPIIKDTAI